MHYTKTHKNAPTRVVAVKTRDRPKTNHCKNNKNKTKRGHCSHKHAKRKRERSQTDNREVLVGREGERLTRSRPLTLSPTLIPDPECA